MSNVSRVAYMNHPASWHLCHCQLNRIDVAHFVDRHAGGLIAAGSDKQYFSYKVRTLYNVTKIIAVLPPWLCLVYSFKMTGAGLDTNSNKS